MQKILSYTRRAIQDYHMIEEGDKIAVGVSGGKDSLVLLAALARLKQFYPIRFSLSAVTLDPCFGNVCGDFSGIAALCGTLGVEYTLKRTNIAHVVFDIRKESNPCALCAKIRRGALHDAALELGCNKVALGHHMNDAVETFLMNMIHEGRLGCFSPVTYLSRKKLYVIRPLIYAPEKDISSAARRSGLPVVENPCPADGHTQRQRAKEIIRGLDKEYHGFETRLFGAIQRSHIDNW